MAYSFVPFSSKAISVLSHEYPNGREISAKVCPLNADTTTGSVGTDTLDFSTISVTDVSSPE